MFLRNGLEPGHLLLVVLVIALLFGARRLPDTARALGKSVRILKSETRAMKRDGMEPAAGSAATRTGEAVHREEAVRGDGTARAGEVREIREPSATR